MTRSSRVDSTPTATIASIVGSYEATEPQVSNLFKRETLSGEFLQINRHLVAELKTLGLWNEGMRARIKMAEGSIQDIVEIPESVRAMFRTVWEIPMRSLIDMAVDLGIVKKSGAWFTYEGEQLGQGRENVKTFLRESPQLMAELDSRVREHLAKILAPEPAADLDVDAPLNLD